jgi:hypothetical protein
MASSTSTLLSRNLTTSSGNTEIFTEDCVFYEPGGVYRGRDEIHRVAGAIKRSMVVILPVRFGRRPVHKELGPVDEARVLRGEERDGLRHLRRVAKTAQGRRWRAERPAHALRQDQSPSTRL